MSEVKNQVEADIPFGAIENGRAFMDRVENHYDFTCEAGPLVSCYEWQEARRCFEHLALWASNAALSHPAPDVPGAEEVESIGRKPVNTNDLRDMASEFRGTTFTEMVIEAANQLDNTRTERNILRAELDAAREELRQKGDGWQDISTAPKDGTRVLLAWDGTRVGYYLDNSKTSHPWEGWKVPSMEKWPPGKPTHWQPLPPTRAQGESS
jgi:hypothetical protein